MLVDKLVCSQVGAIAMLKWMVSVVLATKNTELKKKPSQLSMGNQEQMWRLLQRIST